MQVPYTPYPTVSPYADLPRPIHVETPPAAFGVTIGQAIEGVGRQVEQGGNELFQRAVALQELRNETEAKEADAQYMIGAGQRHAQYSALEGKNAVDAYPQYISDLQSMRQQYRAGLSNDQARRMFDNSSLSVISRTIFNGAGHAAMQNKSWTNGVAQANIDASANHALVNAKDDDAFNDAMTKVYDAVATKAQTHGWSPEQFQDELNKENSKLRLNRIEGTARTNPFEAQRLLDKDRPKLYGVDAGTADRMVQQAVYNVGGRNISHNVNVSGAGLGAQKTPIEQAQYAIGGFESGWNYKPKHLDSGTKEGFAFGYYQFMSNEYQQQLKEAGMPPMTVEELEGNHAAQDQLFKFIFGRDMEKYGSFDEAASRWFTGRSVDDARARGVHDILGTNIDKYLANVHAFLSKGASLQDKVTAARAQAEAIRPDDPVFSDHVAQVTEAGHNKIVAEQRDAEIRNRNILDGALMGGQTGKIPTNLDELLVDPQVHAAWDKLGADRDGLIQQRKYLGVLAKAAKGDQQWTPDSLRRYQTLRGMAQTDPAEFMAVDPIMEDMPNSAKKEFINLQGKMKAVPEQDPRIRQALTILGPDMNAAGITKQADKDSYYQFVGSLQDALQEFQGEQKKMPNAKEVQQIGARLMQQQSTPWLLNPWSSTPAYQMPVPEEAADIIKQDPAWTQLGVAPTDEQIRRIYIQQQYKKLYGGSVSKPAPPTVPGTEAPAVPQSR